MLQSRNKERKLSQSILAAEDFATKGTYVSAFGTLFSFFKTFLCLKFCIGQMTLTIYISFFFVRGRQN